MALIKRDTANTIAEVVLRNTGYDSIEELEGKPNYRIDGLKEACDMILDAIAKKRLITIVGDYDADGVDSSAIMYYGLTFLGANVRVRIPRRLSEGFGLNMNIIEEIDSGLVITVDNGIVAFDPIKRAKEKGLDVIITDHHLPDESGKFPEADLIIDPHIPGTADFADYCGAGIAYRLMKELISDPKVLAKLSCFAAIGTVADVMPLVEENRQIVKEGLKNMVTFGNRTTGLYSILRAADKDTNMTATDIAFKIGPMINACGRLYDNGAHEIFEALVYDGPFDESIGQRINDHNEQRKVLVQQGMANAYKNIAEHNLHGDCPLVVYEPSISEGLVGIIAGHLAEEKKVPTFVFTDSTHEGIYKGSGRSAGGVHLKNLLDACSETLFKYGGHAEAAGVSVKASQFDDMRKMMKEKCPEIPEDLDADNVYYDLEIKATELESALAEVQKYEPYGQGNPKPVFYIKDCILSPRASAYYKTMGAHNEHLKLFGNNCAYVGFDMVERYYELSNPLKIDVVGVVSENCFMGKGETQIEMEYFDVSKASFAKSLLAQKLAEKARTRY